MPTSRSTHPTLRLILRQVPGVVWATDRDLRFTYVRGRGIDEAGPEQLFLGTTVYDFVNSRDPTEPAVAHHLAALAGEGQSFEYTRAGRSFEVLVEPLRDASNVVVGCVGAAIDVTDRRAVKERLASSEARLAEAQRMAHVGSFEWNGRGDHMTWSDELMRIYGLGSGGSARTVEEFLSLVHDDDEPRVRAIIYDAFLHPKPFEYDHRIVRPDGQVRVLHTAGAAVADAGGAVRVVGSCWDVTTQHEMTAKLRSSVSLLEATLDATADGILVVDNRGRVVAHNRRFVSLWRVPLSVITRGDDAALLSFVVDQLEEPDVFLNGVRNLYASPDRESFDVIRFKDGRVFERFSMRQVVASEAVGRVWSFRDVTERERLLIRATFLADATRLLASLDVNKALTAVARLAIPYLGERCAVDLIADGKPGRIVEAGGVEGLDSTPELHAGALAGHSMIFSAGSRSHMAVPLFCRNAVVGAITFVAPLGRQYTKSDLELLDELGRRAGLAIDNARLYEGARDALHGRDEFLSVTAHEIRGPLTSLHLAVQSLLRGSLSSPSARTALDVIEREDRRLARFVEELVDFGRIRTGQMHFALEDVDLGTVLRDVVSRLAEEIARAGSAVSVTTDGNLVGQWDRFRLEQVLTNLLSNAIKYGGGKPIRIAAERSDDHVAVSFVDQGIGIDPAMTTRIFDPFQRAVAARHYGGLGLGLHISKTIVEGLGGTITVDSRPGEGSRFTVDLPVSRSAHR
jgi:PAS domain S-box-containing protein